MFGLDYSLPEGAADERLKPLIRALEKHQCVSPLAAHDAGLLFFFVANRDGGLPSRPADLPSSARVILVGTAWWRQLVPPIAVLEAWRPWRLVGDLLPDEWPKTWEDAAVRWLIERFVWLPPLDRSAALDADAVDPSRRASPARAEAGLLTVPLRVRFERDAPCSQSQEEENWRELVSALPEMRVLPVENIFGLPENLAGRIVLATPDPADAHAAACAIAEAGGEFWNLIAPTSPWRGAGLRPVARYVDGAIEAKSLRDLLHPLFSHTGRHQGRVTPAERPESWLRSVAEDNGRSLGWAFSQTLRGGQTTESLHWVVAACCRRPVLADWVTGNGSALFGPEIVRASTDWRSVPWMATFRERWQQWPHWIELVEGAMRENMSAPNALARVGWSLAQAVCQGFSLEWRRPLFSRAATLFAEQASTGMLTSDAEVEHACILAARSELVTASAALERAGHAACGGSRAAWWHLRSIAPEIERCGTGLSAEVRGILSEWIARDRRSGGPDRVPAQVEALLWVYGDDPDRLMALLKRPGMPDRTMTAALAATYLWLRGDLEHSKVAASHVGEPTPELGPNVFLHAAYAAALAAEPQKSAALLRVVADRWNSFFSDTVGGDARWLVLGLTSLALGWDATATRARACSKNLHPIGQVRDRHFERVGIMGGGGVEPRFLLPDPASPV